MTTAYRAEWPADPATEPLSIVTVDAGRACADDVSNTAQRLVNHDSTIASLVAPDMKAQQLNITVMPVEPRDGGLGECSECAEPVRSGDPAVAEGVVLLDYVTCVNGLVLHRDAVCLACLRGAMNWLRSVEVHNIVIEIPRVPGHASTPATARLEHERRVIVQKLATGAGAAADAASLIQRWDWVVGQLRELAAGVRRDPFANLPTHVEEAF